MRQLDAGVPSAPAGDALGAGRGGAARRTFAAFGVSWKAVTVVVVPSSGVYPLTIAWAAAGTMRPGSWTVATAAADAPSSASRRPGAPAGGRAAAQAASRPRRLAVEALRAATISGV